MGRREILFRTMGRTRFGELSVVTPEGTTHRFTGSQDGGLVTIVLKDWAAVDAVLGRGVIGLGESYMANLWETPDLKTFLTFCQRNRDELARVTRFSLLNRVLSRATTL